MGTNTAFKFRAEVKSVSTCSLCWQDQKMSKPKTQQSRHLPFHCTFNKFTTFPQEISSLLLSLQGVIYAQATKALGTETPVNSSINSDISPKVANLLDTLQQYLSSYIVWKPSILVSPPHRDQLALLPWSIWWCILATFAMCISQQTVRCLKSDFNMLISFENNFC